MEFTTMTNEAFIIFLTIAIIIILYLLPLPLRFLIHIIRTIKTGINLSFKKTRKGLKK